MSKYFYSPIVGIDVSADFSIVAILAPNSDIYRKPFKVKHDVDGFNHLLKKIKKVKNDKKDAINIAKLGKFKDIKAYSFFDISIFTLKSLCRDYYKLVDTRSVYKKKLSAVLRIIFPGYNAAFSDLSSIISINIIKSYQTPL